MIILDKPYISPEMLEHLEESKIPVLANATSREKAAEYALLLLDEKEFAEKLGGGTRIYTVSENSLDWVINNAEDTELQRGIDVMKNKFAMRKAIQALYPDYYFTELAIDELAGFDPSNAPMPFVLKPSVGFFSVGVYVITSREDWDNALRDIQKNQAEWQKRYPNKVVGAGRFLLEEYIKGDEYALDAYFDQDGEPVIVNIMKHDFSGDADVKDRLYYTSGPIIRDSLEKFTAFLAALNNEFKLTNFAAHIEVRLSGDRVIPIECNPIRFAGVCCTDLAWFAYGIRTYDYFLNNRKPDWTKILEDAGDSIHSLIILDKPAGTDASATFDYQGFGAQFDQVYSQRRYDGKELPIFGFLFTRTEKKNERVLQDVVSTDMRHYLS
jgi:Biotin carboxylase